MALIVCPLCVREDDVHLIRTLDDGRKEARCDDCDFTFVFGAPVEGKKVVTPRKRSSSPRASAPSVVPISVVARRFPTVDDVELVGRQRGDLLKQQFLATVPYEPDGLVTPHWTKYRWVFSADGLEKVAIADLKYFADSPIGGSTGDPAAFDKAWVLLGELEAARRIRAVTTHLLRGAGDLEDRLTTLVDGSFAQSMPGWDEPLLTKTLAVSDPLRFVPAYTYEQKKRWAQDVYGIELPVVDDASLTIGRLSVWSNDLLVELAGDGFDDLHHVAAFWRWAAAQ